MYQGLHVGIAVVAAALVLSGCVTKRTYEELKTEKDQEIATLQAERQALQQQRSQLHTQVRNLESQREVLEQNKTWLEQEQIALQTRVGLLAQEKKSLEDQKAELERQKFSLEQQKETLQRQKEALEQQKASLEQQQSQLRQQVEALEQQKTQLLASSQETQAQYDALVRDLTEELQKGELQVRRYKNMLTVDVAEQLFFDSGQASLKDSGKQVLKKVADTLKAYDDKVIRVIGHTDNVPIGKAYQKVFPSNWELSAARATTVVRYLQEVGIPPERLIASGRAEYAPVAANDSAEGRKKNRRIEITLIDRGLVQEITQAAK